MPALSEGLAAPASRNPMLVPKQPLAERRGVPASRLQAAEAVVALAVEASKRWGTDSTKNPNSIGRERKVDYSLPHTGVGNNNSMLSHSFSAAEQRDSPNKLGFSSSLPFSSPLKRSLKASFTGVMHSPVSHQSLRDRLSRARSFVHEMAMEVEEQRQQTKVRRKNKKETGHSHSTRESLSNSFGAMSGLQGKSAVSISLERERLESSLLFSSAVFHFAVIGLLGGSF